nr:hypothetical protein [Micromonospora rosaria]
MVGRPPMAYLTWWRVILAASLLRDTPDTLASIAGRVGYGSPYALSCLRERVRCDTGAVSGEGRRTIHPAPRVADLSITWVPVAREAVEMDLA